MFTFYLSEYNPTGLSNVVGGGISSTPISGYIGEVFSFVEAVPSGTETASYQYRKVYVKNEYTSQSTLTKIWLDAVEHPEQISIAKEATVGDTTASPTTEPTNVTGWVSPENYIEGLHIGSLSVNAQTGVWIRQTLSGVTRSDPYATFRLNVGGLVS